LTLKWIKSIWKTLKKNSERKSFWKRSTLQSKNQLFFFKDMQPKRLRLMNEGWEVHSKQSSRITIEYSSIRLNMQYLFTNEQNRTKPLEEILKNGRWDIDWILEAFGSQSWENERKRIHSWKEPLKDEKRKLMKYLKEK